MNRPSAHDDGAVGTTQGEAAPRPVGAERTMVTCIDYSSGRAQVQAVEDIGAFLEQHRPDWSAVRWINVTGLEDMAAIRALAGKYELHPLSIEDLLSGSQRPKIDAFGGAGSGQNARLFITTRALRVREGRLRSEQVSVFLGHHTVLTFAEADPGLWENVRQRINADGSRLRTNDASFLVYSLLDTVVDGAFPILDHFDEDLERLETAVVEHADQTVLSEIQGIKRQLQLLRSGIWPMREVVAILLRDPHECMSDTTKVYLSDLYDHIVQVIEIIETYRERASDLTESYRSAESFRTNEVMKVLTIIGTIFIPLTFFAGVYGMNFNHIPELDKVWAYPAFWAICIGVATVMVVLFRRRGWF